MNLDTLLPLIIVALAWAAILRLAALVLSAFARRRPLARNVAKLAACMGIGSALVFLLDFGFGMGWIGYAALIGPIVPGAVALLALGKKKRARFKKERMPRNQRNLPQDGLSPGFCLSAAPSLSSC